jgi:hypothetical protein
MTDVSRDLSHGTVCGVATGRVGVHFLSNPALDGQPLRVILAILTTDGVESKVTLHVGDTFPVGTATWRLESVDGAGTYDYTVRIVEVG